MTTDHAELFSALMDREPVDPDALARALDDAGARRALVAFVSLRQTLQTPAPGESEWVARRDVHLAGSLRRLRPWSLAAAAALLAGAVGVGMVAERARTRDEPPEPARVVQFEPLPADMKGR
jgi:negative regulator of sigma E activity